MSSDHRSSFPHSPSWAGALGRLLTAPYGAEALLPVLAGVGVGGGRGPGVGPDGLLLTPRGFGVSLFSPQKSVAPGISIL